jgi:hypothetical protein
MLEELHAHPGGQSWQLTDPGKGAKEPSGQGTGNADGTEQEKPAGQI